MASSGREPAPGATGARLPAGLAKTTEVACDACHDATASDLGGLPTILHRGLSGLAFAARPSAKVVREGPPRAPLLCSLLRGAPGERQLAGGVTPRRAPLPGGGV